MLIKQINLTRSQALRWLDKLGSTPPALSIYIKADTGEQEIEKMLGSILDRGEMFDELAAKAAKSATGAVLYYGMDRAYVIWPPFPFADNAVIRGYSCEPLRAMLEKDWHLALVLVRLGQFAIGIFKGEKLIEGKAGTGLVHARHKKGGSSANRFARHRAKQMEYFFTRVEAHAREILEPRLKGIDYILYGGTRDTLLSLQKQCGFFSKLEPKVVGRLLSVREPKRATFEEAVGQAYTSTVFEYEE
jgi:peptide subunit release factor 1 (eRF1)